MPQEKRRVRFILSPTGKFNLAYHANEEALLPKNLADEVVEAKYAVYVEKGTSTSKE